MYINKFTYIYVYMDNSGDLCDVFLQFCAVLSRDAGCAIKSIQLACCRIYMQGGGLAIGARASLPNLSVLQCVAGVCCDEISNVRG